MQDDGAASNDLHGQHSPIHGEPVEADEPVHHEPHHYHHNPEGEEPEEEAGPLFSWNNMKVVSVSIFGATLNGYSIGFVAVYSRLFLLSTDCSSMLTSAACVATPNAECKWFTGTATYCGWRDITCGVTYGANEAACRADSRCVYSYSDNVCKNPVGYTSVFNGIFAGAMIVGALLACFVAGPFIARVGFKVNFLVVGIIATVCSVMYHVSTATNEFWVLVVARLVIGFALGLVNVGAPMYVDQNCPKKHSGTLGVFFQIFTTFGIFFSATIGLAVGQSLHFKTNEHIAARMQALNAFSTVLSFAVLMMGILLPESKLFRPVEERKEGTEQVEGAVPFNKKTGEDGKQYTYLQLAGPLFMGAMCAATLQLTGINAVMNYAPIIMGNLNLSPLVGNEVVMIWNFVTTLASIPLASFFTMRQIFLVCSAVASLACLFLCGIPVYPGVARENVKNGVAITGIFVFIAAFEFGIGPCFYVLAQDLYPRTFRHLGGSFTQLMQFIFNVIINVCYPIATEAFSGGASGNQDKGQAIAFIFFGCIGIVCFVLQFFFLYPWENPAPESESTPEQEAVANDEGGAKAEHAE